LKYDRKCSSLSTEGHKKGREEGIKRKKYIMIKKEILARSNHLLSLIQHSIENNVSNNSSIIACVLFAMVLGLPSLCLTTTAGDTYRHTEKVD
jgi:L-cystine uptake protein TcyP (sodium:dicarboxylate symporter family)